MFILTQPPTKSEIFTVYNKLRAALRLHDNPKAIERVNRALGIIQSKALPERLAEYAPNDRGCGCKDWEFRTAKRRGWNGVCKHMMVFIMLQEIAKLRIERAAYTYVDADGAHVFESAYRR